MRGCHLQSQHVILSRGTPGQQLCVVSHPLWQRCTFLLPESQSNPSPPQHQPSASNEPPSGERSQTRGQAMVSVRSGNDVGNVRAHTRHAGLLFTVSNIPSVNNFMNKQSVSLSVHMNKNTSPSRAGKELRAGTFNPAVMDLSPTESPITRAINADSAYHNNCIRS